MSLLYQDIGTLADVQFCPVSNRDWECARDRSRECRREGGSGSSSGSGRGRRREGGTDDTGGKSLMINN